MKPTDTVARLADLLRDRGVELQGGPDEFTGDGADAAVAWEVFKTMASEPAYEPFDDDAGSGWGVDHELLQFEANPSDGWRRYDGTEIPPQYWISILRQFSGGEENEGLFGPELTIRFPLEADDPLREHTATEFGEAPGGEGPLLPAGFAQAWLEKIESLEAFAVPMKTVQANGFSFGIRQVG